MKLSLITATYNRPQVLERKALPSVLWQQVETASFEWIVVNDGASPLTAQLLQNLEPTFDIVHVPMTHPTEGFGLCHARNRGLQAARAEIAAYLDDDNVLAPEFVASTIDWFERHPQLCCSMVRQRRRRDAPQKRGKSFISPPEGCSTAALIGQEALFDSNGFAHRTDNAPLWNPDFRIFCDYEYFLRCLGQWGEAAFALQPGILVDYVQTADGIIGQSRYGQWARELLCLCAMPEDYPAIGPHAQRLKQLALWWQTKASHPIAAFKAV